MHAFRPPLGSRTKRRADKIAPVAERFSEGIERWARNLNSMKNYRCFACPGPWAAPRAGERGLFGTAPSRRRFVRKVAADTKDRCQGSNGTRWAGFDRQAGEYGKGNRELYLADPGALSFFFFLFSPSGSRLVNREQIESGRGDQGEGNETRFLCRSKSSSFAQLS